MDWEELGHNSHLEQDPLWIKAIHEVKSDALPLGHELAPISTLGSYVYQPLNAENREIRVLNLQGSVNIAGRDQPVVRGSLQHVSLDSNPFFFALSYVWGDATHKFPILLDGKLFNVTTNLLSALNRLLGKSYVLPIWIDAICINQDDVTEKSSQVQEMGNIYRAAQLVIGWLGPEADSSTLAIKAISYLGAQAMDMPDGPSLQERYELFFRVLPSDSANQQLAFPTASVIALFNRPWWQRVWIVQEVVLAKNVFLLCGDIDVHFFSLLMGFTMIFEIQALNIALKGALETRIKPLLPILNCDPRLINAAIRGHDQDATPLRERMLEVTSMQATDARDHILALLGMVSDADELGIRADYSKSCAEIYTQTAAGLITKQGHLQILSNCQFPKVTMDLPTWVPDWSAKAPSPIWQLKYSLFRAGGKVEPRTSMRNGRPVLMGAKFETIQNTGPSWNESDLIKAPNEESFAFSSCLRAIERFIHLTCLQYTSTGGFFDNIVWRVPIADTEGNVFTETGRTTVRATEGMKRGYETLRYPESLEFLSPEEKSLRLAQSFSYKAMMIHVLCNRRIFVTQRGFVGIGPQHLQAGDQVCLFWGAEVPFILRKPEDFDEQSTPVTAELIGECYVHSIMDGEALGPGLKGQAFSLI